MKRVGVVVVVIGLVLPFAGVRALGADPPEQRVIVQGAGLAAAAVAAGNVDPNVDFWPMYSESSIDNESSHGLSGAVWPGFLLDAFFWLYGYQPTERAGFGISETQWPNPPNTASASSSRFMLQSLAGGCTSFFGADSCGQFFGALGDPPISGGDSASRSAHLDSSGSARGVSINVPGLLEATEAWTRTSSRYVGGRTVVESLFAARNITIGDQLHIDMIEARSVAAAAGNREGSHGASTLKVIGAKLGDTPVTIDDQGMHTSGDRSSDSIDQALAPQGIEVRTTLGRTNIDKTGEFVDSSTGGLFINILRQRAEEALPAPLVEQKDAACAAAADNPLNREITHIRVDQPNPLYGQIPLPGVPQRAQLEQSVPPPFECPFFNRDVGVTLALGLTDASARLSPLPALSVETSVGGTEISGGGSITHSIFIPGTLGTPPIAAELPAQQAVLAAAPHATDDAAKRIQALYGLFALLVALGVAGRFVLKFASAP
jgi:hypothetical protein